jgi:hypothetical protein
VGHIGLPGSIGPKGIQPPLADEGFCSVNCVVKVPAVLLDHRARKAQMELAVFQARKGPEASQALQVTFRLVFTLTE